MPLVDESIRRYLLLSLGVSSGLQQPPLTLQNFPREHVMDPMDF
jgi:hypothetical protein